MKKEIIELKVGSPLQKVLVDKFEAQEELKKVIDLYLENQKADILRAIEEL